MRIEIEIPKEFESDYTGDKFKDFFSRVLCDIEECVMCGNYEKEIAEMFTKAFDESKTMELMQGDLISRSRVIENIWDVFNSYANDSQRFDEYETKAINNAFKVLQKQIENQPTVYDLEKVVQSVRETIYQMGLDESQAEIIVADIRNGGKE